MADRANITSTEAIDSFRANLILYLGKARPTLDEIGSEVSRIRNWVQTEQMENWSRELKKRGRALEDARAAVFSAKLSSFRETASAEQLALTKAKNAYDEVEAKLRRVRRWSNDFDNKIDPLFKQLEKFNTLLADDLTQGVRYLTEIMRLLDDYTDTKAPSINDIAPTPAESTVAPSSEAAVPGSQTDETKEESQ